MEKQLETWAAGTAHGLLRGARSRAFLHGHLLPGPSLCPGPPNGPPCLCPAPPICPEMPSPPFGQRDLSRRQTVLWAQDQLAGFIRKSGPRPVCLPLSLPAPPAPSGTTAFCATNPRRLFSGHLLWAASLHSPLSHPRHLDPTYRRGQRIREIGRGLRPASHTGRGAAPMCLTLSTHPS